MIPSVAAVVLLLSNLNAGSSELQVSTLEGVRGFEVHVVLAVENHLQTGTSSPLDKIDIQTDIELELRTVGLPVVNERKKAEGYLEILILGLGLRSMRQADRPVFLQLKFSQQVIVIRDGLIEDILSSKKSKSIITVAPTWRKFNVIYSSSPSEIREEVIDLVRQFANDFLEANPKKTDDAN